MASIAAALLVLAAVFGLGAWIDSHEPAIVQAPRDFSTTMPPRS